MNSTIYLLLTGFAPQLSELVRFVIQVDCNDLPGGWDTLEYFREYQNYLLAFVPKEEEYEGMTLIAVDPVQAVIPTTTGEHRDN